MGFIFIVLPLILITHLPIWKVFLIDSTDEENEVQREKLVPQSVKQGCG